MAAVTVTADVARVDDAEDALGWLSIGGGQGGSAEGSFPYQGNTLYNRKVTGSSGFYYDPTSDGKTAQNMTAANRRTWMAKAIVTDYGGLQSANGLEIRVGSGTNAYHEITIAGTDSPVPAYQSYPAVGGLIVVPVDPNIAGYRTASSGNPNLAAASYFGLVANFVSSTAKSENVGLDAIDIGAGLLLVGGDGASVDGTYQDFVATDQNVITNRWGFATALEGGAVIKAFGKWQIGSAVATGFSDTSSAILWPDHFAAAGFSGISVDLTNALTAVVDGTTQTGLGNTNIADSRPDYTVSGTLGTATLKHTLNNFRNYHLTAGCSVIDANVQAASIIQNGASITNSTLRTNSLAGVGALVDPLFSDLSGVSFVQTGTGHAIQINTPGAYTFNDLTFSGYGADGSTSAAIYNNSGGLAVINITGGNSPTVRNGAGATTDVVNSISLTLTNVAQGSEVTIVRNSDDVELFHTESVGASGEVTYGFSGSQTGTSVRVLVHEVTQYENLNFNTTLPGSNSTIPINQTIDRNYSNPI